MKIEIDEDCKRFYQEIVELIADFETEYHRTKTHSWHQCMGIAYEQLERQYNELKEKHRNDSDYMDSLQDACQKGSIDIQEQLIRLYMILKFRKEEQKKLYQETKAQLGL